MEVAGVEPASPELLVGLLRAEPVIDLGSPPLTGGTAVTPASLDVPSGPEAQPDGKPLKMTSQGGRMAGPLETS